MVPFLYLAIKSLYWSKGGTLKKIMWCDDDAKGFADMLRSVMEQEEMPELSFRKE